MLASLPDLESRWFIMSSNVTWTPNESQLLFSAGPVRALIALSLLPCNANGRQLSYNNIANNDVITVGKN